MPTPPTFSAEPIGFETTQVELARRVGVSEGYFSLLERGEVEGGAAVRLSISREFGKSVDWLLTGEDKDQGN
jgi:transcriptional regulator with XRE-family HTH domain